MQSPIYTDNNFQRTNTFAYDNSNFEPLNPEERQRVEGIPVGLKNIGNTCYFNSLIQTYFMIPNLVKEVLSFNIPEEAPGQDESKANSYKLLAQLQRLFANMIGSCRRYVDPSLVLNSITDDLGNKIDIGHQRDVGEFNMILVSRIDEAMKKHEEEKDLSTMYKTQSGMFISEDGVLSNIFYGRQIESIIANEKNGDRVSKKSVVCFGQINLDVEHGDLYTA